MMGGWTTKSMDEIWNHQCGGRDPTGEDRRHPTSIEG